MKRRRLYNLLLLLALLSLPASSPAGADAMPVQSCSVLPGWFSPSLPPDVLPKIEPALLKLLLQEKEPRLRFVVHLKEQADLSTAPTQPGIMAQRRQVVTALQTTAEQTQAGIRAFLAQEQEAGRTSDLHPFWIFNGLALTGGRETAFALAARSDVALLRLDHQRRLPDNRIGELRPQSSGIEWNIERIRAPLVWDALGIDGAGVVVANLDTGVDWLHPALQSRYRGYDPHGAAHQHNGNWFDSTGEGAIYPVDGNGHGTHTMGTITGDEGIGVAPGARWIAVRAFNNAGVGYDSWIHAAFEWLLAPAGDPALAPDVINNSWGNSNGSSEVFYDDLRALRAAGIWTVFSAGNNGPGSHTVGSPASYPEALSVGATDSDDEIAYFSSRGPSPWEEIKPEVSAPGVDVRSALPGGGYGSKQGTSMAAPHVAGVLALMRQANAALTITATEQALTGTALPLPAAESVPNNDYGWGRVDAYDAVMAVAARGILSGTVTSAADGAPLPLATISATPTGGGATLQTTTDDQGRYAVGLYPGQWDVSASAFAHAPQTVNRIEIITGATTTQDFALTTLPTGLLSGTVSETGSGAPLSATIAVEGTPAAADTNPANGAYSLSLPAGVYTISARSEGHRAGWAAAMPITVGQTTIQHFSLLTAPTILLIDSGPRYYGSQIEYYRAALDDLNYLYDTYSIKHLPDDLPTITDTLPYSIVIWSAPADAPGYIGASRAITPYLESGGRLLLSGQEVGYWDGGGSGMTFSDYYRDYLYARFIADNASSRQVSGRSGDIFDGLNFSIEGGDGADNQDYPDVIEADNPDHAASVLTYQGDGSAGQRVGLCLPYRALYLAFGFEGINNAPDRQEVMSRAIDWLMSPRQEQGVSLTPQTRPTQIAPPGQRLTHVLRLRNTGETQPSDIYDLSVESAHGWAYTLSGSAFTLASCQSTLLTLTIQIPPAAAWDETEIITLTARSQNDPAIAASAVITSKTPAPILLVDDDRWYDQQSRYTAALQKHGYRYDLWDVRERKWSSPPADILSRYPIVLWYTAYDWYSPLTADEENRLMDYLDAGGRLFFSAQDYLYVSQLSELAQDYFGLIDYTEDLSSTVVTGLNGNPVGDWLGPYPLDYPYRRNWSDALEPALGEDTAFKGEHGLPTGVSHADENHKTIFFSFPFETMDEKARATVMERIVGWLSWLGDSTLEADKSLAAGGETLTYTLALRNDGPDDVALAVLSNTLPLSLSLVPGSLSPPEASYVHGAIHWQGALARGQAVVIQYQAQLTTPMPVGSLVLNPARIYLAGHDLTFTRTARTRVNAPDLDNSLYAADRDTARPGETLTYTLVLLNDGLADTPSAWAENRVPDNTSLVSGSLTLWGGGTVIEESGHISWTGTLLRDQAVTLTYQVLITNHAGYDIAGRARLFDGYGQVWEKETLTSVPYFKSYLPLIFKNYGRNFWPLDAP